MIHSDRDTTKRQIYSFYDARFIKLTNGFDFLTKCLGLNSCNHLVLFVNDKRGYYLRPLKFTMKCIKKAKVEDTAKKHLLLMVTQPL